jgi:hypothetical protein
MNKTKPCKIILPVILTNIWKSELIKRTPMGYNEKAVLFAGVRKTK